MKLNKNAFNKKLYSLFSLSLLFFPLKFISSDSRSLRLLIGIILSALIYSTAFGETMSLRADSWCPFNCNPKSPQAGYMIDVVREVFKKKGITIDYQLQKWDLAKKDAADGKIQGVVGASKGDGDFIFTKHPLGRYQNYLFYLPRGKEKNLTQGKANQLKLESLEDLKGIKIGIVKDYAYGEKADKFIANQPELFIKVSGDEPLETLIQMLEDGKIQALYECPQVFLFKLKLLNKNYSLFRRGLSFDDKADDLFVAFSKKESQSHKYAQWLDQGIEELRKSGKLLRILDNYALTDWE